MREKHDNVFDAMPFFGGIAEPAPPVLGLCPRCNRVDEITTDPDGDPICFMCAEGLYGE